MNKLVEPKIKISSKRTSEKVRFLTAEDILYSHIESDNVGSKIPLHEFVIKGLLSFGNYFFTNDIH